MFKVSNGVASIRDATESGELDVSGCCSFAVMGEIAESFVIMATRVAGEGTDVSSHDVVGAEYDCCGCSVVILIGAEGARVVGDRCCGFVIAAEVTVDVVEAVCVTVGADPNKHVD